MDWYKYEVENAHYLISSCDFLCIRIVSFLGYMKCEAQILKVFGRSFKEVGIIFSYNVGITNFLACWKAYWKGYVME